MFIKKHNRMTMRSKVWMVKLKIMVVSATLAMLLRLNT